MQQQTKARVSEALAHTQCRDMHSYSIATVVDMMSGTEAEAGGQAQN